MGPFLMPRHRGGGVEYTRRLKRLACKGSRVRLPLPVPNVVQKLIGFSSATVNRIHRGQVRVL